MNYKSYLIFLGLTVAALSPAPINDISARGHQLPAHSDSQRHSEQRYNGVQSVVGSVPIKTNEDGTAPAEPKVNTEAAANIVAATPIKSDPRAVENLTRATQMIDAQQDKGKISWMTLVMVVGTIFCVVQGARHWLEKHGPTKSTIKFY